MATPNCCSHDDNMTVEKGDEFSEESVCQTITPEDGIQSRLKSKKRLHPLSCHESMSIHSSGYLGYEWQQGLVTVPHFTFDPITLRRDLAKMIILHEYPLSMVDHLGFRDFLRNNLYPSFEMVSQSTIEKDIMNIFEIESHTTWNYLSEISSKVAITAKMWTSIDGNRRFLAITGHMIDQEWKKQSLILRFANVPLHCAKWSICRVIPDCLSFFNLEKKVSTLTVDSYTDKKLINIVDKFSGNEILLSGKLFRLPCFAHTLSLMVQDGFNVVRHVIENIQDLIVFWTSSSQRDMEFKKAACDLGVTTSTNLVLDDGSNWNSTYLMLQDAFHFKDVFIHLGLEESSPSDEEWELTSEVCQRLQFLHGQMEQLLCCPTACLFLEHICEIKVKLLEWLNCEVPEIKQMASKMAEKFDEYWFAARDILGVATIFNPYYRFFTLEFYFPKIYGNEAESETDRTQQIFYNLFKEYKNSLSLDETYDKELRSRLLSSEVHKSVPAYREVELYQRESNGHSIEDSDILSWWEENETRYPVLQKMAKDILAIPIFSVDSENAFDVGDRILGANRSRLRPKMVEALMCTQRWLRRWKNLDSEVSYSDANLHSLGTISDDANMEHGIIFEAMSAESVDRSLESQ